MAKRVRYVETTKPAKVPEGGPTGPEWSAVQGAVNDIPDTVTQAIANDGTVVAAAVAAITDQDIPGQVSGAVTEDIAGRSLVEGESVIDHDVGVAITDRQGKATSFVLRRNGDLHPYAVEQWSPDLAPVVMTHIGMERISSSATGWAFVVTDGNGRIAYGVRADGTPYHAVERWSPDLTPVVMTHIGMERISSSATGWAFVVTDGNGRIAYGVRADGTTYQRNAPDGLLLTSTADWVHWGDSLTATGSSGDWVSKLAVLTGRQHLNGGWGGQGPVSIAARQGGIPGRVAVAGDAIPASGSVALTVTNAPIDPGTSIIGSIAGVSGTLARDSGGDYTFTRSGSGSVVTVYPGALFLTSESQSGRPRTVTIWVGRNGVLFGVTPSQIVESIRGMISYLSPVDPRVIIMSIPPSTSDILGNLSTIAAANTAILDAFPREFLDIAGWLRSDAAATAVGITFDGDDESDIAAGFIPRCFTSDGLHYNDDGGTAIAHRVYHEAQTRGWL